MWRIKKVNYMIYLGNSTTQRKNQSLFYLGEQCNHFSVCVFMHTHIHTHIYTYLLLIIKRYILKSIEANI